jgi:hypothetical protein
MSDDQLHALGLPRREFLRKAAAGVFVAPVIVSFALGSTAEATAANCFPNQNLANQFASSMGNMVILIYNREQQNLVDADFASVLRAHLLDAEGKLLDGDVYRCCNHLKSLQDQIHRQSGKQIDAGFASQLGSSIQNVWNQIGCAAC